MTRPHITLLFHGIGEPPDYEPENVRPYWIPPERFEQIIVQSIAAARDHDVNLYVTFDDGYASDFTVAAPVLARHRVEACFFVCAGRIGVGPYTNAANLRDLRQMGFSIGSHGYHHVPWRDARGPAFREELVDAKAVIEDTIGEAIDTAAIPFGSYDRRVLAGLRDAGFRLAFNSDPGLDGPTPFLQRRFCYRGDAPFEVAQLVRQAKSPRWRAQRNVVEFWKRNRISMG